MRELLKDGAQLIVDPEQAVEVVGDLVAGQVFAFGKPKLPRDRAADLDGELRRIYDAVTEDCTVDDVAANSDLAPPRVASGLAELEGLVSASHGRWCRSGPTVYTSLR